MFFSVDELSLIKNTDKKSSDPGLNPAPGTYVQKIRMIICQWDHNYEAMYVVSKIGY